MVGRTLNKLHAYFWKKKRRITRAEQARIIVIVELKNFWYLMSGHFLNTALQMSELLLNKLNWMESGLVLNLTYIVFSTAI